MKVFRHITGLIVAPVIALLFVHLTFVIIFWLDNEKLWWRLTDTYDFGVPVAYLVTSFIGIPIYIILRKLQYVKLWHFIIAGLCMYAVPFTIILAFVPSNPWYVRPYDGIVLLLSGGIGGAIIGLLFWFIALYQIKSNLTSGSS